MTVAAPPPPVHPRAAFASPAFRVFQSARLLANTGWAMQVAAVGYQVYALTGSKLALGYVGLASFLPAVALALVTGHVADRYDRRRVVQVCQVAMAVGAAALLWIALKTSSGPLDPVSRQAAYHAILAVLVFVGVAHAFLGPASQALMPSLVPPEHFPNAVAWNSAVWQSTAIAGPALGGLLLAWRGPAGVYGINAVGLLLACLLMGTIRAQATHRGGGTGRASWETLLAGLHYVWRRKIILGSISLDLFAVLLGGATALLPVYARDILKVDEMGYGILRASPAVGAAVMSVSMAYLPPMKRAGATMLWAVALFGCGTIVFGLSESFPLSMACLAVMGAADMVSVIVRQTLVQITTPHEMRGRVSAVNLIFIGASNELGEFESGVVAHWFGTVNAVLIGGVGTLIVVGLWALLFPQLRRVGRLDTMRDEGEEEERAGGG